MDIYSLSSSVFFFQNLPKFQNINDTGFITIGKDFAFISLMSHFLLKCEEVLVWKWKKRSKTNIKSFIDNEMDFDNVLTKHNILLRFLRDSALDGTNIRSIGTKKQKCVTLKYRKDKKRRLPKCIKWYLEK